jgi:hypothetical protein
MKVVQMRISLPKRKESQARSPNRVPDPTSRKQAIMFRIEILQWMMLTWMI